MKIERIGVIGAGTMGNGIEQCFAAAGYPVARGHRQHDEAGRQPSDGTAGAGRPDRAGYRARHHVNAV
ncbi:hypothetical protein E2978_15020 [Paracoccus yeei]